MPIEICPSNQCVGCAACANICPSRCITMTLQKTGYYAPSIDAVRCVECGQCIRYCPPLNSVNKPGPHFPQSIYACWSKNDRTRLASSSGGMFTVFAEEILRRGGVVYGAAFDDQFIVRHRRAERIEELEPLRQSKYVESFIGEEIYREVATFLKEGHPVFFTGTPCQIDALYSFLRENANISDELLFTADLICHGVPSPEFWANHLKWLRKKYHSPIKSVFFRSKKYPWGSYYMTVHFENGDRYIRPFDQDVYLYAFLYSLSLRESCYQCRYASTIRMGDITLGDFWKIGESRPFHFPTKQGVSLIMVNSNRGEALFRSISHQIFFKKRSVEEAAAGQPHLIGPAKKPVEYLTLSSKNYAVQKGLILFQQSRFSRKLDKWAARWNRLGITRFFRRIKTLLLGKEQISKEKDSNK